MKNRNPSLINLFKKYIDPVCFIQWFYVGLLEQLPVYAIEEFKDLGRLAGAKHLQLVIDENSTMSDANASPLH